MNDPEEYNGLLLSEQLGDDEIRRLLSPVGFSGWRAAHRCLLRMADGPQTRAALANLLPHLLMALASAADPDRVLVSLERFANSTRDRSATFRFLASNPRAVEILVTLFAGSQFLTEILLRNPEYFQRLAAHRNLAQPKTVEQYYTEAQNEVNDMGGGYIPQLDGLRRYQRMELLRIGACDLLGLFDLPAVTMQLSNLADSLVRVCLTLASAQSGTPADGFAVIAMGKLGGRELNYSSDIDLIFLTAANASDHQRLGKRVIEALTRVTAEGFLYRVDMRLRPWGRVGALVSSLDGYLAYMNQHARLWEKQALLKARAIAGDGAIGDELSRQAEPLPASPPSRPTILTRARS